MAKQDGIIPLKGTIDNLSFYKTADGYIARKKSSISGDRLATDPAFKRTREAMSNFGKAGIAGKLLRTALRPLAIGSSDKRVVSRLTGFLVAVIKGDRTNPRGQKKVVDGISKLEKFEFNESGKLSITFFPKYVTSIDRATGTLQVNVPAFIPAQMMTAPFEATHFQVHVAGVEVDFENSDYAVEFKKTEYLSLGEKEISEFSLSVSLPAGSAHPLFLAMAVTFATEDLGVHYPLTNGAFNALAIVKVSGV